MRKLKFLFLSVMLFGTVRSFAGDSTDSMIQEMLNSGGKPTLTFTTNQVNATYYITAGAQKLIDTNTFDTPDPQFSAADFNQYINQTLTWAVVFYSSTFNSPVTDIHFAIDDLGDDRQGTVCETYVNTRYVHCDFRRVHKMYKGFRAFLFPLVLVHEYTHANQYARSEYRDIPLTSSAEGRPLAHDRELKAIAVEISAIISHDGADVAYANYVKTFRAGCNAAVYNLEDETLLKQTGRRCLLLGLWTLSKQGALPTEIDFIQSLNKLSEAAELGFSSLDKIIPGFTFQKLKEETLKLFP